MYEIAFFHFLGCRSAFRLTKSLTKQALNRALARVYRYHNTYIVKANATTTHYFFPFWEERRIIIFPYIECHLCSLIKRMSHMLIHFQR